jgi:hypothetical protein
MEHRLSSRTPLNANVVIYYNSLGLLQARSVDVSRHGMLVRTWPMTLPLHAIVDVAFPLQSNKHGMTPQRTPAMVVRQVDEGVGLMFANELSLNDLGTDAAEGQQNYPKFAERYAG